VLVEHEGQGRAGVLKPKTRRGTKQVAAHFPEDAAWQLCELAVEQRATLQDLLGEALNDLFQKYGKPEFLPSRQKARA
jgi:predicted GNAT superfamily acetyltransferase